MEFRVEKTEELPEVCKKILAATSKKIFLLYGDLGAGKTTLTKEFCKELGSADVVSSPTFSIVNHYLSENNESIFHFDFYRIKSPSEAMDIGFEEYIDRDVYCFIEWPEIILKLIFTEYVTLEIKAEENFRIIKVDV